jgi:hypothetical protein
LKVKTKANNRSPLAKCHVKAQNGSAQKQGNQLVEPGGGFGYFNEQ